VKPLNRIDKPRQQALEILRSVEDGVFADTLLEQSRHVLDSRDIAFITEIVYGVLRNRERIDWALNRFSKQAVGKTDARTRTILRLGAYQLLFLDRVPASAAINTAVELAKHYGKNPGYVNGLLRNLDRNRNAIAYPGAEDPVRRLSVLYSHPEWLVTRWLSRFGPDTAEAILRDNNRPAPLVIRTNTLKTKREELHASLESDGAKVGEVKYSPAGLALESSPGLRSLSAFRNGWFFVQDEAAQLVGMMLAPKPGETVLDACAAPGGKATHLAELMKNEGTIVALEKDKSRIGRITENSDRLGVAIIRPEVGDASTYHESRFDKILIDAPCSGLGVLRRHPDGRWTKTESSIPGRRTLQKKILKNCAGLLKPGGALVYATCTTEPEENEEVIIDFLATHSEFTLDDPRPLLPASAGKLVDDKGFFRTFPGEPGMDGFFAARMARKQ
jgi:16S rRNA (cytosine967-C5)-methyltransferase